MDTSDLRGFIDEVARPGSLRVEDDFGSGFVRLRVSEAQRRQAKQDIRCVEDAAVEMLRNARDAHAKTIFFAVSRSGDTRTLVVIDDGDGVPVDMHELIFEPRVTSKLDSFSEDAWGVHGRGMALYSIKENAEEAAVVASAPGRGSVFRVSFLTASVRERKDQSTLPTLDKNADGAWELGSGPRNIVRVTADFALDARRFCTVYFGSPVQIAATLRAYGESRICARHVPDAALEDEMFACRLSSCRDAAEFASCAESLGLSVSQRSAYRILQNDIAPLAPLLAVLRHESVSRPLENVASPSYIDARGLKIAPEDRAEFTAALKRAWALLASAYYLEPDIDPQVRVSRDGVRVVFPAYKQL